MDVLWIIEEVYAARMNNEDLTRQVCAIADRHPIELIYCDPAEPGSIEMFRRNNLPAKEGMNRILPGIQAVTARINTGRLKVLRSCKNIIDEAGLYRYPNEEERKVAKEEPVDEHNHALAALRYMICGIDRVRELGARAPQVLKPESLPEPDHGPDGDYRKPIPQTRYQTIEQRVDESEEMRRLNQEHLETQSWDNAM